MDKFAINPDGGNVGIGTDAPLAPLHVKGISNVMTAYSSVYTDYQASFGTWHSQGGRNRQFSLITEDNMWCQGSEIHLTSDSRIKTDISVVQDDKALQQVNALESKEYHYIEPKRRRETKTIGFIAQEVKEIIPNAVSIQRYFTPRRNANHCRTNNGTTLFNNSRS